jgi:hypothetical protein
MGNPLDGWGPKNRNPKPEIRRKEENPKTETGASHSLFGFRFFFFPSDFWFRISGFESLATSRDLRRP